MNPRMLLTDDLFFRNFSYFKAKYCLSRKAMSKLLGVSVYMIEDMEKHQCRYDIPLSLIVRISQIFGVDMNDMISFDLSERG